MIYLHPVLGGLALIGLVWLAAVGLRARHRAAYAKQARATHRRLGPWVLGLVLFEAVSGTLTVATLRTDLDVGRSWHFVAGWSVAVLMASLWAISRWIPTSKRARRVHPWVGYLCLAAAVALGVLGFDLLP